jgi:hypothetical protein
MWDRKNLLALLTQFVLIIVGVLVSLFFQSKFDDSQKRSEGIQILQQIDSDLRLDTAMFSANIKRADYLMGRYTDLLARKSAKMDAVEVPEIVKGILATDTKLITFMNKGGYLRFTSFGNYELYKRSSLINDVLHYYNNRNEQMLNMSHMDTEFVEKKVVDYYLSHHMGNLRNYFEQSVLHNPPNKNTPGLLQAMLEDEQFQSLVIYDYINKDNYRGELVAAREEAVALLRQLKKSVE